MKQVGRSCAALELAGKPSMISGKERILSRGLAEPLAVGSGCGLRETQ